MKLTALLGYFSNFTIVLLWTILTFCSNSSNQIVGVAHHVSFMRPYGLFDIAAVSLANSLSLFPFIDEISKKMDFIGVNYYGQVWFFDPNNAFCTIPDMYSRDDSNMYIRKRFRVLAWSWWKMMSTVNLDVEYILMAYIACYFSSMKDTSI